MACKLIKNHDAKDDDDDDRNVHALNVLLGEMCVRVCERA